MKIYGKMYLQTTKRKKMWAEGMFKCLLGNIRSMSHRHLDILYGDVQIFHHYSNIYNNLNFTWLGDFFPILQQLIFSNAHFGKFTLPKMTLNKTKVFPKKHRACLRAVFKNNFLFFRTKKLENTFGNQKIGYFQIISFSCFNLFFKSCFKK